VVLGLSGEEKGSFKDISGVVSHQRIRDVKAFDVLYRRSLCPLLLTSFPHSSQINPYLDVSRHLQMIAQLDRLPAIESDKLEFLING